MNIPSSRTPVRPEAGNLLLESKENQLVVRDPNGIEKSVVGSNPTGVTGASAVTGVISLSQANYDALATKDASTLYVITA